MVFREVVNGHGLGHPFRILRKPAFLKIYLKVPLFLAGGGLGCNSNYRPQEWEIVINWMLLSGGVIYLQALKNFNSPFPQNNTLLKGQGNFSQASWSLFRMKISISIV